MPDFTEKSSLGTKEKKQEVELDAQEETLLQSEIQTELLRSINNKLTFFTILVVLSLIITIFNSLASL